MSKKHFIALADRIREANSGMLINGQPIFTWDALEALADFCQSQNPRFNRERWLGYINGTNGPNGGKRV
jgi:hypothetical protein